MAKNTTRLKAGQGASEANAGGKSYPVGPNGEVVVPSEHVAPLTSVGGFSIVSEPVELPEGHVLVAHSDPNAVLGEDKANEDGHFVVPVHAVAALLDHGFVPVEFPAPAEPAPSSIATLKIPT